MRSLFGKKSAGSTVVVLDVQSSSVGGALVRLTPGQLPRVFLQHREHDPVPERLGSDTLLKQTLRLSENVLLHTSEAASRLRHSGKDVASFGDINRVVVLLNAPWAHIQITSRTEHTAGAPKTLTDTIRRQCQAIFGDRVPVSFQAFATAASGAFAGFSQETLFALITGEVTELVVARDQALLARATFPVGINTVLRTLQSHAGFAPEEGHSALRLFAYGEEEPFSSAAQHFTKQFSHTVRDVLNHAPARDIVVVAMEPYGEWHARALAADPSIGLLFEEGGIVRALRPMHLKDQVLFHAAKPDLFLTIGALYAGSSNTV